MKDIQILKRVRRLGRIKTVITRERGKYVLSVMKDLHGGRRLGYMGAITVLEVTFNKIESAKRLKNKISKLNN